MEKINMLKRKSNMISHSRNKKNYRGGAVVPVPKEPTQFSAKPKVIVACSTISKKFKSFESKPIFSAEIIESVLGVGAENRNGIIFKCPPKGQPAFKIKD